MLLLFSTQHWSFNIFLTHWSFNIFLTHWPFNIFPFTQQDKGTFNIWTSIDFCDVVEATAQNKYPTRLYNLTLVVATLFHVITSVFVSSISHFTQTSIISIRHFTPRLLPYPSHSSSPIPKHHSVWIANSVKTIESIMILYRQQNILFLLLSNPNRNPSL